jgi:PTH1 family peptidyl-tRNA hydrolase
MHVVVGLGNPGRTYANTRHNIGFVVVDEVARRWGWQFGPVQQGLRMSEGRIGDDDVMLVEPQTYMNRSGGALAGLSTARGRDLIVIHDDLDLDLGRIRVKFGGGTAGHHGLDSIVEYFGATFTRIRIGVGRSPCGEDAVNFVLSRFTPEEIEVINQAVHRAADAVECILREGTSAAMNRFNAPLS